MKIRSAIVDIVDIWWTEVEAVRDITHISRTPVCDGPLQLPVMERIKEQVPSTLVQENARERNRERERNTVPAVVPGIIPRTPQGMAVADNNQEVAPSRWHKVSCCMVR